ncbi:hypothetical protein AB0H36_06415 [Kribbella sp. NPDC050820]|uniref:4'-phosphopantetheinyl transferase family protein n=1 Tax=Kribbella sp. NPDC050820 TaxID=3155408 RepID=UPI0033F913B9
MTVTDSKLLDLLDDRDRLRIDRIAGEADRARILIGAALLRSVAGSMLGIPAREVVVDRTCPECGGWHGRPTLPGTDLDVSVSHSGMVVAVAVLPGGGRVGVDVERINDRPVPEVIAWTLTEAQFKAGGGSGLTIHRLPDPAPGHVMTLATNQPTAGVTVVESSGLLRRTAAPGEDHDPE